MNSPEPPLLSTPTLSLHRLQESDIPSIPLIYARAFASLPIDRAVFPSGPSPEAMAYFGAGERRGLADPKPGWHSFVVKDNATHEVIAVAKWQLFDAGAAETKTAGGEKPPVLAPLDVEEKDMGPPGGRMDGKMACNAVRDETRRRLLGSRKWWYLRTLATLPEHQCRGAGALAMRWGQEQADRDGLDSFLFASPFGKHLYEKCGFEVVEEEDFDLAPYGHDEHNISWAMVRKARTVV